MPQRNLRNLTEILQYVSYFPKIEQHSEISICFTNTTDLLVFKHAQRKGRCGRQQDQGRQGENGGVSFRKRFAALCAPLVVCWVPFLQKCQRDMVKGTTQQCKRERETERERERESDG